MFSYRTAGDLPGIGECIVMGDRCIYSGTIITGSTINFAEDIILTILRLRKRSSRQELAAAMGMEVKTEPEPNDFRRFQFFDLQTHRGYHGLKAGSFHFSRVDFNLRDCKLTELRWREVYCPYEVYRAFLDLIGEPHSPDFLTQVEYPEVPEAELQETSFHFDRESKKHREAEAERQVALGEFTLLTPEASLAAGYENDRFRCDTPREACELAQGLHEKEGDDFVVVDGIGHPNVLAHAGCHNQVGRFSIWSKSSRTDAGGAAGGRSSGAAGSDDTSDSSPQNGSGGSMLDIKEYERKFLEHCAHECGAEGPNGRAYALFSAIQQAFTAGGGRDKCIRSKFEVFPTAPGLVAHLAACAWVTLEYNASQPIPWDQHDSVLSHTLEGFLRTLVVAYREGRVWQDALGVTHFGCLPLPDWFSDYVKLWTW